MKKMPLLCTKSFNFSANYSQISWHRETLYVRCHTKSVTSSITLKFHFFAGNALWCNTTNGLYIRTNRSEFLAIFIHRSYPNVILNGPLCLSRVHRAIARMGFNCHLETWTEKLHCISSYSQICRYGEALNICCDTQTLSDTASVVIDFFARIDFWCNTTNRF